MVRRGLSTVADRVTVSDSFQMMKCWRENTGHPHRGKERTPPGSDAAEPQQRLRYGQCSNVHNVEVWRGAV